ncbi:ribosome biogenesis protein Nop16 [Mycena olivaceomarginata]|nr:ribosome biogenesis protein Nop16 [Mycena olivaceomarginata]
MANPRQRRKARSSSHRPVSHARNAKRNPQKNTPCLTSELAIRGPAILSERWDKRKNPLGLIHTLNPSASRRPPPVNPTAASTSSQPNPAPPIPKGHGANCGKKAKGVVEELERIASSTHNTSTTLSVPISGAGPRHASGGEVAYLKRLVDKYGTDVEQMARDRKLNAEQRTVGQLTRSLKRCGFEARS